MKKLIFIVFVLLMVSNLSAVQFNLTDFKDKEFQRHFLYGAGLSAIGWNIVDLFCGKTVIDGYEEGFDKNGVYYYRKIAVKNPNHFPLKMLGGIVLTCAVANLTHQEAEPDCRAIMVGCMAYLQFQFLLEIMRKIKN